MPPYPIDRRKNSKNKITYDSRKRKHTQRRIKNRKKIYYHFKNYQGIVIELIFITFREHIKML